MNKIAIILAEGFEDVEFVGTADVFKRSQIGFDLISIENLNEVKGQEGLVKVDTLKWSKIDINNYKGIFIPGGSGHKTLLKSKELKKALIDFNKKEKFISAICAGPEVLKQAGIVTNRTITAYPGFAVVDKNTGNNFEIDGHIVTGKNMQSTMEFAEHAAELFLKLNN